MENRRNKRQLQGIVVSNKMQKSVIILVERLVLHDNYKKYIRQRKRFAAHDENNTCQIGDKVLITESRPISKTKKWRISKIIEKAV